MSYLISANPRRSTSIAQVYTVYSSSAGAANSFMRSIFAAVFPVVTHGLVGATGTKLAG